MIRNLATGVSLKHSNKHAAGRPKDMEKRNMILYSASELFLRYGFGQTTMDAVARDAGVSKQTVYSHFANKDELFEACISRTCQEYQLNDITAMTIAQPAGLAEKLHAIATQFVALMHDPRVIAMYTVVIAESKNNPSMAERFYKAGPDIALTTVTDCLLEHNASDNEVDARELALAFFNLLKGDYHFRSILSLPYALDKAKQMQFVDKTCHKFMRFLQAK